MSITLGAVGDAVTHDAILRSALEQATSAHPAGTIVPLPFRWHDDLRARQLRKEAH